MFSSEAGTEAHKADPNDIRDSQTDDENSTGRRNCNGKMGKMEQPRIGGR